MHHSDLIAEEPALGINVLVKAFDLGGDVKDAWGVLNQAIGYERAKDLLLEEVGARQAARILYVAAWGWDALPHLDQVIADSNSSS
jgi:hypothetical protein